MEFHSSEVENISKFCLLNIIFIVHTFSIVTFISDIPLWLNLHQFMSKNDSFYSFIPTEQVLIKKSKNIVCQDRKRKVISL